MTKPTSETVHDFNEMVNMTPEELEEWLETEDSKTTGWQNPSSAVGPGKGGEAVGHESGRHIVKILRSNPSKKEADYSDEDLDHMRRVVAYCKRHLAQEEKGNDGKDDEELRETKSYRSLKNWGHDAIKKRNGASSSSSSTVPAKRKELPSKSKAQSKKDADEEEEKAEKESEDGKEEGEVEEDGDEDEEDQEDAEEEGEEVEELSAEEEEDDEIDEEAEEDEPDKKKTKRS